MNKSTARLFIRLILIALGLSVILVAAAGRARLIRPDILAAVACSSQLLAGSPDPMQVVMANRDGISREAGRQDLPPELMAVIIYNHQRDLTPFRRFTDCSGSALGYNLSLGPAQVRMGTASEDSGRLLADLTPAEFHRMRLELLDPATNIAYQARELRLLLERKHRSPGISADTLIRDPATTALLMSEYRAGRTAATRETSKLSASALFGMQYLLDDRFYLFGRPAQDVAQIKALIFPYLEYISCDSGIFNASVCEAWQAAH